jgi:hypothetical protein
MKCRGRQGVEVKERREGKISAAEFSVGRELQASIYRDNRDIIVGLVS